MIPAKVFVLDLDDTLINTKKVTELFEKNLEELTGTSQYTPLLWQTYEDVKKEKGFVDYHEMSHRIGQTLKIEPKKVLDIFYQAEFKDCLFPKAVEIIEYLQTLGKVVLFSQGELELQSRKINKSGVEKVIGLDNIQIIKNKKEKISELIKQLKTEGFQTLSFIDDKAEILDEAYEFDKSISCYWIRSGKYKDTLPKTSCVTFQSSSLGEIFNYIYTNNTVAEITSSSVIPTPEPESIQILKQVQNDNYGSPVKPGMTKEIYKVKKGLASEQIRQLITFTHQDKQIQQFTSDLERFFNKESFKKWLQKGKYIYTLVDSRNNLLGIMWFNEKQPPVDFLDSDNYKITLGIRIYGQSRGKGLGKQFFATSFRHFKSTPEYGGIKGNNFWSVISSENIASKKLHESFGFKQVTQTDKQGKIVMIYKSDK